MRLRKPSASDLPCRRGRRLHWRATKVGEHPPVQQQLLRAAPQQPTPWPATETRRGRPCVGDTSTVAAGRRGHLKLGHDVRVLVGPDDARWSRRPTTDRRLYSDWPCWSAAAPAVIFPGLARTPEPRTVSTQLARDAVEVAFRCLCRPSGWHRRCRWFGARDRRVRARGARQPAVVGSRAESDGAAGGGAHAVAKSMPLGPPPRGGVAAGARGAAPGLAAGRPFRPQRPPGAKPGSSRSGRAMGAERGRRRAVKGAESPSFLPFPLFSPPLFLPASMRGSISLILTSLTGSGCSR